MNIPDLFIQRTAPLLPNDFELFREALNEQSPVSIRINRMKRLTDVGYESVPWSNSGYYLPERLTFTFDPLFHAGAYYVQEASSMFVEQAIQAVVKEPVVALDLCAAPGGKSTHLLSLLPADSLLVANEVIRPRSKVLSENVLKWGSPHAIVTQNDPKEIGKLKHTFDLMVADVPCSGEGMFRKDPESINEWSEEHVHLCAARQQRILTDAWQALKPGGFLVYSTCTYNLEENEHNLRFIIEELGAQPIEIPIDPAWQITRELSGDYPVYRFFPHKTKGEGFFLAVVQKVGEASVEHMPRKKKKGVNTNKDKKQAVPTEAQAFLVNSENFRFTVEADATIKAYPVLVDDFLKEHASQLRIVSAGITIGQLKGKNLIPDCTLAFSQSLNTTHFYMHEVSLNEAIRFLQKEVLILPPTVPNGFILLTYKEIPIGFVKQIGTRANNLFPQDWKIRTKYLPEDIKTANI